jgi:hypothetical protein
MAEPETTYKWAAILWLLAGAMWIGFWLIEGPHRFPEYLMLGMVQLVTGLMFVRAWRRQRLLPRPKDGARSLLLAPSPLRNSKWVLGLALFAAILSMVLPLMKLLLGRT